MKFNVRKSVSVLLFAIPVFMTAQWTQQQTPPGIGRSGAVSWVINGRLYIVGGGPGQTLQEYDPSTDQWVTKAPVPWQGYLYLGSGFVLNGKGYIGIGTDGAGTYLTKLWMYDPQTNTWTQRAPFPGPGRVLAFSFSIGNKGYVGAGGDALLFYKDFYEYDAALDTWTQKSDFPGGIRAHVIGGSVGNYGYAGTGVEYVIASNTFVNHSDLFRYDPSADSWSSHTNVPGPDRLSAVCFSSQNELYAGLGCDNQDPNIGTKFADLYKYNPVTNTWDTLPSLSTGRAESTGAFLDTKPYIAYGRTNSATLQDLWSFKKPQVIDLTGVGEIQNKGDFLIWPGIANDHISIRAETDESFRVSVSDSNGKNLYDEVSMTSEHIVPCSAFENGFYFISVQQQDKLVNRKIIILH